MDENKKNQNETGEQEQLVRTEPHSKSLKSIKANSSMDRSKLREQQLLKAYGGGSVASNSSQTARIVRTSQQIFRQSMQFDKKVVHDQINSSPAKMQFTFPKANRFNKAKESYCQKQFYESQMQSMLTSRGTTLGYGGKSDFTKCDKYIPGPTNYKIRSGFEAPKLGGKFAYGRQELEKMGPLGFMNQNPGPGTYDPKLMRTQSGYSLGIRTTAKHIYIESTTPPPGSYETVGLNPVGKYYIGKHPGSGAAMFSPTSSHMSQSLKRKMTPGPGTYDPPGDISKKSQNMPSHYSYSQGYQFGRGVRKTQELPLLKTPGPGAYSVPSEFGDWDFPPPVSSKVIEVNQQLTLSNGFQQEYQQ